MNPIEIFALSALALVAYFWVGNRLAVQGQIFRMQAAELGEDLLDDSSLADQIRDCVESMLDQTFSVWFAWTIALLTPVAAMLAIVDRVRQVPQPDSGLTDEQRMKFRLFLRTSVLAIVCNSPIAMAIVLIEFALMRLFVVPVGNAILNGLRIQSVVLRSSDHNHMYGH